MDLRGDKAGQNKSRLVKRTVQVTVASKKASKSRIEMVWTHDEKR